MQVVLLFVLLLSFVFGLGFLARRLAVPYPILFVIGGLAISFIPILPTQLELDPTLIFFLFLPPLLYIQAFNTSWRDFRFHLRPILLLAIGLVLATTITVAYVAHWLIPDFPLAAGFVLGAIISPPDAIAASAIAQRLGLPRRITTILEGESLVNDATSLVVFGVAVKATLGIPGLFSRKIWWPVDFIYVAVGGIIVGLVVGWLIRWIRRRVMDDGPEIILTVSLLTPFVSYLLADKLQVSGVLSVVATGLFLGWESPEITTAGIRLPLQAVWEMIVYLLNGTVFVLIGLQLPGILHGMREYGWLAPFFYALAINAICVFIRIAWVFPGAYLPYLLSKSIRAREGFPNWRQISIIGWSGMRGIVSLAAALTLNGYDHFPRGHLVQFLAFSVILTTLVFQGLTLPFLIRFLGVGDDGIPAREEIDARVYISEAAFDKLREIRGEEKFPTSALDSIEQAYREQALILKDDLADELGWSGQRHHVLSVRRLRRLMIATQRRALVGIRRSGRIGDDVMHKIEHELDLEEARLKS
jgi:Na+/H+ antiporter